MSVKEFKKLFDADKALLSDTIKYERSKYTLGVLVKRSIRNKLVEKVCKSKFNVV